MTAVDIALIGTEYFHDYYGSGKLSDIHDWVENTWENHIEDGSGSYEVMTDVYTSTEIPSSAISGTTLAKRRKTAEDWVKNNKGWYSNYDVLLMATYWGGEDGIYGNACVGCAGGYRKSAMVDTFYEYNNMMTSTFDNIKTEGVAWHEVGHTFCAWHADSGAYSDCDATLMHNPNDSADCFNYCSSDPDLIIRDVSSCTKEVMRCFIDNYYDASSCSGCY